METTVPSDGDGLHRYEQIAAELRAAIERGDYREGDRIPGENAVMKQYGVARATARDALAVLQHEGLATARRGAGVFVTARQRIVRDGTTRYSRQRAGDTSPFRSDARQNGQRAEWTHRSAEVPAPGSVAGRLGIDPGDPVMETTYVYRAGDVPIQLSRSWEPLALTRGTPVERPEEGPVSGVVARMDLIGQHVDRVVEKVTARAARPDEVEALQLPRRGAHVLVIDRTHYVGDRAVETCDITVASERYELTYTIPVPG